MRAVIFCLVLFIFNHCQATAPVRVSEFGADGFYFKFNDVCQSMEKTQLKIKTLPKIRIVNANYSVYVGNIADKLTISIYSNKEGYISKVMLAANVTDTYAMNLIGDTLAITLTTLGVNKGEMKRFFDDWSNAELTEIVHWCSSTHRFIIINRTLNFKLNTFSVTFSGAA